MKLVVLILAVLGSVCGQASEDDLFELNIIHYNDFHAHFDEVSPSGTVCQPEVDPCVGGFARLYTAVNQAFEAEPDSLLLNGGDTFQGTIWYNFLRWNVSRTFMNMMPHDAHVLGNHEFDHGVEGLVPYVSYLNSTVLGANVNTTFEPDLAPHIKNHVIVTRNGRQIGIIGVLLQTRMGGNSFSTIKEVTIGNIYYLSPYNPGKRSRSSCDYGRTYEEPPPPIGQVIMEDEVEAINREAAILTEQGVDIIIVLSHCGYTSDIAMAARVVPEVDIIVGAHSHTLLYTGETENGDTPGGDYPTVVTQQSGHRIPIVQASCYTRYLGIIKLFIDSEGIIQSWEGQPIYLGTSIIPDPYMLEQLEPWREEVDAVGKEVLGKSIVTLNRSWCYRRECNMGSWACDGFLEELMPMATDGAWHHAHVCMINAGGLRVQINPGNVTTEGLLMAMPFENYVQVYDLKGEHLLEALEFSVGVAQTPGDFYSGRMLQIGGMRNVYNASAPVGSRVTSSVRCISCDVPRYEPLDRNATYRVVTQNYIGDGGGGYTVLSENRENLVNLDLDYVMLQRFMRRQQIAFGDLDGRIEIVY